MMFKTHIVVSLVVALLIFPLFNINKGVFLLIFLLGALLPDIDAPTSFLGKHFKAVGFLFGHRGIFHSVSMLLASGIIIYAISSLTYALVFAMGYALHLLIDMLNYEGIRLFYPLGFRIKGFIKADSLTEKLIFVSFLIAGIVMLI